MTIQPGHLVKWKFPAQPGVKFVGKVIEYNGNGKASVQANGTIYDVEVTRLKRVLACIVCGEAISNRRGGTAKYCSRQCYIEAGAKPCAHCGQPVPRASATYCSRQCFSDYRIALADQEIFAALVEYKRAHDGLSPSVAQLAKGAYMHPHSVAAALDRMEAAGRIRYVGDSWQHRGIMIVGAVWTYEEPTK